MFLIGIIVAIVIVVVYEFNLCVRLRHKCYQSKSSIDVFLTQRFDLIPNLVECVKGVVKYENERLEKIAVLRKMYDTNKEFKYSEPLNKEFDRLLAVAEKYPEVKSQENFLNLQRQIVKMESQLQAARRNYNGDVTLYNTTIQSFPTNIFAEALGFKDLELFEANEDVKKNN